MVVEGPQFGDEADLDVDVVSAAPDGSGVVGGEVGETPEVDIVHEARAECSEVVDRIRGRVAREAARLDEAVQEFGLEWCAPVVGVVVVVAVGGDDEREFVEQRVQLDRLVCEAVVARRQQQLELVRVLREL